MEQSVFAGFFGKIPARGDFVQRGLPANFIEEWDNWWQSSITASQERLGADWTNLWMEAPIWRFALAPGVCGAQAAVGLWMPSADRVGRLFPLTIAKLASDWGALQATESFLQRAENAGLAALERDLGPDELATFIEQAVTEEGNAILPPPNGSSKWWTEGSPAVAPGVRAMTRLPDEACFVTMLQDV